MTAPEGRFGDLGLRIVSAIVLAAIGGFAIWSGGLILGVFVACLAGCVGWELSRMFNATMPLAIAAVTFLAVFLAGLSPWEMRAPLILAATGISFGMVRDHKVLFTIAHLLAGIGALSFLLVTTTQGLVWTVWLVGIVVITDIAGYFAGRVFGGPKFWPSLSPKKTWSGTAAGWLASAVFGVVMIAPLNTGAELILLSILISFASQMGDIFESLAKRRAGVKDSSRIIPGHGGVWDRFDGMLGAALVFWPLFWVL